MTAGEFLKGGEVVDSRIDFSLVAYAGNDFAIVSGYNDSRLLGSDGYTLVFEHLTVSADLPVVTDGDAATAKLPGGATLTIRKKAGWEVS